MSDEIKQAKQAYDAAAAEVIDHVLACTDGCTMQVVRCPSGERAAAYERATWDLYRDARWPKPGVRP
jgi:hypothetical protein